MKQTGDSDKNLKNELNLPGEELKKQEFRVLLYREILDAYIVPVVLLELNGLIYDYNPAFSDLPFLASDHLKGEALSAQLPAEAVSMFLTEFGELRGHGAIRRFSFSCNFMKSQRFYDCVLNVLSDYILVQFVESTAVVLAEERASVFASVLWHSPTSIVITDSKGTIEYVNPKFTEVTGYAFEEVVGENPRLLKSGEQSDDFYEYLWQTIVSGKTWQGEFHNKRKDGTLYWELASISAVQNTDNEIVRYIAVKEDITDRKLREKELQEAKRVAEEADRLKSAFLANMSHEIRTPMNAIIGFTTLLKGLNLKEPKATKFIDIISSNSHLLLTLLDDIISISKLEAGQLKVVEEPCQVNVVLKKLYATYISEKEKVKKNTLTINLDIPLHDKDLVILTDCKRFTQILNNLLSNALKFTTQGEISFGYSYKSDNELLFFVRDTGIGIPLDKQALIFKIFGQVQDHMRHDYRGTGLGLSISKYLVDLLGGILWLDSEEHKGSVFYFTLPLKRPKPLDLGSLLSESRGNKSYNWQDKHILLVDDEQSNYIFICEVLTASGCRLDWAKDGYEAIAKVKANSYDLVLMDIKMPGMDGFSALKALREYDEALPVVAQTAHVLKEESMKIYQAGFTEYLSKPLKISSLLNCLHKIFSK